ncbi:hypothetical protein Pme01_49570 [Planosporangium mesophilum]|uniref:Uncharacterized protein n=2 Tax=Planosporangium mesophilum TaxID=689768 RepID=A0A8J3TDX3_9ACTN|nr:hypothetical protein Pme01_49570 [Planosporangium mesophilum]
MEDTATSLVKAGAAASFEIAEDDGLQLRVYRAVDGVMAEAWMTAGFEVSFLHLGEVYRTVQTAYDDEYQREVLDDFLASVEAFIKGDYYEEVGERNGRVASRKIYFNVPGGTPTPWSASLGLRAFVSSLLGYTKSTVRPHSTED